VPPGTSTSTCTAPGFIPTHSFAQGLLLVANAWAYLSLDKLCLFFFLQRYHLQCFLKLLHVHQLLPGLHCLHRHWVSSSPMVHSLKLDTVLRLSSRLHQLRYASSCALWNLNSSSRSSHRLSSLTLTVDPSTYRSRHSSCASAHFSYSWVFFWNKSLAWKPLLRTFPLAALDLLLSSPMVLSLNLEGSTPSRFCSAPRSLHSLVLLGSPTLTGVFSSTIGSHRRFLSRRSLFTDLSTLRYSVASSSSLPLTVDPHSFKGNGALLLVHSGTQWRRHCSTPIDESVASAASAAFRVGVPTGLSALGSTAWTSRTAAHSARSRCRCQPIRSYESQYELALSGTALPLSEDSLRASQLLEHVRSIQSIAIVLRLRHSFKSALLRPCLPH